MSKHTKKIFRDATAQFLGGLVLFLKLALLKLKGGH